MVYQRSRPPVLFPQGAACATGTHIDKERCELARCISDVDRDLSPLPNRKKIHGAGGITHCAQVQENCKTAYARERFASMTQEVV